MPAQKTPKKIDEMVEELARVYTPDMTDDDIRRHLSAYTCDEDLIDRAIVLLALSLLGVKEVREKLVI
jgi:hypothetical protein